MGAQAACSGCGRQAVKDDEIIDKPAVMHPLPPYAEAPDVFAPQPHRNRCGGNCCGMGPSSGSHNPRTPRRRRHLVLNMDVNKTFLMSDSVSGKSSKHIVNETLSNAAWGHEVDGKWVLHSLKPSVKRPPVQSNGQADCSEMLSYAEWVAKAFPGEANKKRTSLNGKFTDRGEPGELMADFADTSLQALKMPDGSDVRILPGFFELLPWLKRERRSFSLFFRTFGEDLPEVAAELNTFCEGKHPMFPGVCVDGSDGFPDYRLYVDRANQIGTFHRDSTATSLVMGTTEQPGEGCHKHCKDRTLGFYKGNQQLPWNPQSQSMCSGTVVLQSAN